MTTSDVKSKEEKEHLRSVFKVNGYPDSLFLQVVICRAARVKLTHKLKISKKIYTTSYTIC